MIINNNEPCGCHYEFRPEAPYFQVIMHLCPKHYAETLEDHNNQPARRWKWPEFISKQGIGNQNYEKDNPQV